MNWFNNIEKGWKKAIVILGIFSVFGVTPTLLIKQINLIKDSIRHTIVSNQIYNSAFRGLYRLDYVGKILKDEKEKNIEIRSTFVFDDYKEELILVEWVFVIDGNNSEMYEAIYAGIDRGYHFIDKNGDYYWVYDLKSVE